VSRSQTFKTITNGEVHRQIKHIWFDHRLAGNFRDEAPSAYKDIHAVMRAQRPLTRIVRVLRPVLSYKGASEGASALAA
jgi:tRNA-splicing ligase RtcB